MLNTCHLFWKESFWSVHVLITKSRRREMNWAGIFPELNIHNTKRRAQRHGQQSGLLQQFPQQSRVLLIRPLMGFFLWWQQVGTAPPPSGGLHCDILTRTEELLCVPQYSRLTHSNKSGAFTALRRGCALVLQDSKPFIQSHGRLLWKKSER